jgi:hypothetical protein
MQNSTCANEDRDVCQEACEESSLGCRHAGNNSKLLLFPVQLLVPHTRHLVVKSDRRIAMASSTTAMAPIIDCSDSHWLTSYYQYVCSIQNFINTFVYLKVVLFHVFRTPTGSVRR